MARLGRLTQLLINGRPVHGVRSIRTQADTNGPVVTYVEFICEVSYHEGVFRLDDGIPRPTDQTTRTLLFEGDIPNGA